MHASFLEEKKSFQFSRYCEKRIYESYNKNDSFPSAVGITRSIE